MLVQARIQKKPVINLETVFTHSYLFHCETAIT